MNEAQPDPIPRDEERPNSWDSLSLFIDGPWDTTVRPRPPHIPRSSPGARPPEQPPRPEKGDDDELPKGDANDP